MKGSRCFSVTGFCRCCDPCWCGSLGARVTSYDPFTYWVHWLLNLLETSSSPAGFNFTAPPVRLFVCFFFAIKEAIKQSGRQMKFNEVILIFFFIDYAFQNKLFHRKDLPISDTELRVNYAHSSLTYLMAGLCQRPTQGNWKVCHH